MKRALFLFAAVLTLSLPALPVRAEPHVTADVSGNGCYRIDEAEAEQAIRIHSELMVIGLNCQSMPSIPNSSDLYNKYRVFTARHGKLLAEYEARLIGYFVRVGARDPNGSLNSMRTEFANKIALEVAHMRPDLFCSQYAPRIDRVANMSDSEFRKWSGTFYPGHPLSHPMCGH